ncbi:RNA-binding protein 34-like [Anopheles aquasalis]|uniref:RNA-binding protein 34-like n=1 Tax=Anopheles aquasalis TaxID=42839 RepID=UPI00215A9560|nr:RNA-binding protein 34-like [Anopheles aquasalis]
MKLKGKKQIKQEPEELQQVVKIKKEKGVKQEPEDAEMAVVVKQQKKIKQKSALALDDASKQVKKKDKPKKNKALAEEKATLVLAETTQSAVPTKGKKAKKAGSKLKDAIKEESDSDEQVQITKKQKKIKVKTQEASEPEKKPKASKAIPDDEEVETSESETEDEEENAEESSSGVAIKSEETKAVPKGPEHAIFIGNLPPTINQNKVKSLFKPYGTILSVRFRTNEGGKIPRRKDMKKLKSLICYIRFSSKSEMQQACTMDGQLVEENRIRVCPQKQKQMGAINSTVFVGNISISTTDNELYDFFSGVGEIEYVRQIANKGVAFVCFKKGVSIKKALKLNQQPLNGRALRIMEVDPNRTNVKTNKKGNPVKRVRLPKSVLMRKKPGSSGQDQASTKNEGTNEFHGKVVADAGAKKKKKGGFGKKNNNAKIIAQKLKAAAKVAAK